MMNSQEILDREFLEIRAKVLQVGAALDRIERAPGDISNDAQRELLIDAIKILVTDNPQRAERIQLLFSREYDENWQERFSVSERA